ncbi:MAG: hypothetical protein QXW91_05410 [Candidatus Nitrosotenuis sp.]
MGEKDMFKFVQSPTEKTDYIVGRQWSLLKKAWKDYKVAKENLNNSKAIEIAQKIQTLQKKLGINVSEFPELK